MPLPPSATKKPAHAANPDRKRNPCSCRACASYDGGDPSQSKPGPQFEGCRYNDASLHDGQTDKKKALNSSLVAHFKDLSLSPSFAAELDKMLKPPTRVQQLGIPLQQKGGDLVLCAQTGTGKTAAYLIPMIDRIMKEQIPAGSPTFCVISPTRELALQIDAEFRRLSSPTCKSVVLTGRKNVSPTRLNNCHLLVGTPGKVRSMLWNWGLNKKFDVLVVDGDDKIAKEGYGPGYMTNLLRKEFQIREDHSGQEDIVDALVFEMKKLVKDKLRPELPDFYVVTETAEQAKNINAKLKSRFMNQMPRNSPWPVCEFSDLRNLYQCYAIIGTVEEFKGLSFEKRSKGALTLEKVQTFVIDEFDRMMDKGFLPDIGMFCGSMSKKTQLIMASATWRQEALKSAQEIMRGNFERLQIGNEGAAQEAVVQKFEKLDSERNKSHRLNQLLVDLLLPRAEAFFANHKNNSVPRLQDFLLTVLSDKGNEFNDLKVLVFFETRESTQAMRDFTADRIYNHFKGLYYKTYPTADRKQETLILENFGVICLSSDLEAVERESHMKAFSDGIYSIMFATNVAARGIDPPRVTHVINYDLPSGEYLGHTAFDEYIHRIGRTGRLGNPGESISFMQPDRDSDMAAGFVAVLANSNQPVPDWLKEFAKQGVILTQNQRAQEREARHHGGEGQGFTRKDKKKKAPTGGKPAGSSWDPQHGPNATELWGDQ
eukprot:sb/3462551/